jgi:hypothetical protein
MPLPDANAFLTICSRAQTGIYLQVSLLKSISSFYLLLANWENTTFHCFNRDAVPEFGEEQME